MSVWSWLLNHWREGDELLHRQARRTAGMVERIRQLRHREPYRDLVRPEFTRRPTATGPPRRRRRRRSVVIEETIEEDDPDYAP